MHKTKPITALFLSALIISQSLSASEQPQTDNSLYFGASAGIPLGFSTYSSFGHDELHAGPAGGIFAGYRLSRTFSIEADLGWGHTSMSARQCCSGYWIGEDWNTYYGAVLGMNGWDRSDTRADVWLQKYGVRFNADLLGLIPAAKDSRWHIEVSPQIYLYGSKSAVRSVSGKETLLQGSMKWHLGYGATLQAGYGITDNLRIAIACGINILTGSDMDGLHGRGTHGANAIMETSLRLSWDIPTGLKNHKPSSSCTPEAAIRQAEPVQISDMQEEKPEPCTELPVQKPSDEDATAEEAMTVEDILEFPETVNVFFDKSSWTIESSQEDKLAQAALFLIMHPEVFVEVHGWCDKYGTEEVNATISDLRARAVKDWLIYAGVSAERISTEGHGVDHGEKDRTFARRAGVIFKITEK